MEKTPTIAANANYKKYTNASNSRTLFLDSDNKEFTYYIEGYTGEQFGDIYFTHKGTYTMKEDTIILAFKTTHKRYPIRQIDEIKENELVLSSIYDEHAHSYDLDGTILYGSEHDKPYHYYDGRNVDFQKDDQVKLMTKDWTKIDPDYKYPSGVDIGYIGTVDTWYCTFGGGPRVRLTNSIVLPKADLKHC